MVWGLSTGHKNSSICPSLAAYFTGINNYIIDIVACLLEARIVNT
jgi:hypothetical protein